MPATARNKRQLAPRPTPTCVFADSAEITAIRQRYGLTRREMEAMLHVIYADGDDSGKHIGPKMGCSGGSVGVFISTAMKKLGVRSKTQAALAIDRLLRGKPSMLRIIG